MSLKVFCYGDSLTAGYSNGGFVFAPYSEQLEVISEVTTCGMSGWTTEDMLSNLDSPDCSDCCGIDGKGFRLLCNGQQYDFVFLLAGTNDLGTDIEADEIFSNICSLVDVAIEASAHNIGILTVPACSLEWKVSSLQRERAKLNKMIRGTPSLEKYASRGTKIFAIDISDVLPNGEEHSFADPEVAALWDADGLHFSKNGSKKLGQFLKDFIASQSSA